MGTAVSRKPAITAERKPNRSSCACQATGVKAVGGPFQPLSIAIQMPIATAAQMPARRKKGRKPKLRIAGPCQARIRSTDVVMGCLPR